MDGRKAFQLYLIGRMRNAQKRAAAMAEFGWAASDADSADQWARDTGVDRIGTPFSAYTTALGEPVARIVVPDGDPYNRVRLAYCFPAWSALQVVVFGSVDGVVAGVAFDRRADSGTRLETRNDLEPWRVVRDDLETTGARILDQETWYPLWDVTCEIPRFGARYTCQFDFGLLQSVQAFPAGER